MMVSWPITTAISLLPINPELFGQHEQIELILWFIAAIVSLIPIIIFAISYYRVRSTKILITTLAFILFFAKALVLSVRRLTPNYVEADWWWVAPVLDIVIICLIAYSLSKNK